MSSPLRSPSLCALVATVFVAGLLAPPAWAQRRAPDVAAPTVAASAARRTGFELELHGLTHVVAGRPLELRGVAYEVLGLATLRALPRAHLVARLVAYQQDHALELATADLAADAEGRFTFALTPRGDSPESANLIVTVAAGQESRLFATTVEVRSPHVLDLLTDRALYEPGETVHLWTRLTDVTSGAPVARRTLALSVGAEGQSARLGSARVATTDAGVAALDLAIPATAAEGELPVVAELTEGSRVTRAVATIRIGRRTVERLAAAVRLDQQIVGPGGRLTGEVVVRTPSGAPVRGATVEVRAGGPGASAVTVVSDARGSAAFALAAPAYLSAPVAHQQLDVRVVHRAYGTLRVAAGYVMSRVAYAVEAVAAGGGVVPEVPSAVYLSVADPLGAPPPPNTVVALAGAGFPGGSLRATTDVHGIAVASMRLPVGAAARHAGSTGECNGRAGTSFDVTVETAVPVVARLCVPVARMSEVAVHAAVPVVVPGGTLEVSLERRPAARGRALAVDVLHRPVRGDVPGVLLTARVPAGESHVALHLPAGVVGPLLVRARPVGSQPGAAEGAGSYDVVLARPAHAFRLELAPERAVYHVRERAALVVRSPLGMTGGHLALVARDLAAHGGESPYALRWSQALDDAAVDPATPAADRVLRVALAAFASEDEVPVVAAPLVPREGAPAAPGYYRSDEAARRGDIRDPFALRDELVRRGVAPVMRALEAAVERATEDSTVRGVIARSGARAGFEPGVVRQLVTGHALGSAPTLGGDEMTLAMLQATDPDLTFDHVAARVARRRLVRLLAALARFVDPGEGQRSGATGEPAERWLSRMVQRGVITAGALRDPWGGSFALRAVAPGHEAVAIAVRASGWELRSPGPDRAMGTADDVANPFARVVPAGTPYAVASGEDALMRRVAALDPGQTVLAALGQAYGRVGAGASEDTTGDVVGATSSEEEVTNGVDTGVNGRIAADDAAGEVSANQLRTRGVVVTAATTPARYAIRGPSSAAIDGLLAQRQNAPASPAAAEPMFEQQLRREDGRAAPAGANARLSQLAALVRERFPATVHVLAHSALDPSGATRLELPLADALTTYRVDAIAWTDEGWTTSASTDVRVDQDAVVDAPVPPVARIGDVLRLPARISNRSARPLRARVSVTSEGDLDVTSEGESEVDVAPGDAREVIVVVTPRRAGSGTLVVHAVDAATGAGLDAARRPLLVRADARAVRMTAETLVDGRATLALDVPADATYRADGSVRVTVGEAIFGDPRVWGALAADRSWPAWAVGMGEAAPPAPLLATLGPLYDASGTDPAWLARAVSALWWSEEVDERVVRAGLGLLTRALEVYERLPRALLASPAGRLVFGAQHADALLGLAPAYAGLARRPALAGALRDVLARLRRSVENNTTLTGDTPERLARAAAGLGLTDSAPGARALEFMRRAQRALVRSGDDVFVEAGGGDAAARVRPSAVYALAALATGDRATAFALVRTLGRGRHGLARWDAESRALATAVLARLMPRGERERTPVQIAVDGRAESVVLAHGVAVLASRALSTAGRHTVVVTLPAGSVLIAAAEARYGRPWSAQPEPRGPMAVTLEGAVGARDARAAFVLRVNNRGARVLAQPVIEVDLPAGAELDQDARNELQRRLARPLAVSDGTLVLPLRALAPGGFARIPLPLRWSVGGRLRGLGLGAYAADAPGAGVTVVPSREVLVPDAGEEPAAPPERP